MFFVRIKSFWITRTSAFVFAESVTWADALSNENRAIMKVNSLIQKRLSSKIEKLSGNQTEMSRLFGSSCAQQIVNLWTEPVVKTKKWK